uniref:Uncharacterized protein n=1 Tax=Rhizophora mucronata TaxID=61149 RepID=A0A2P2IXQ2_RHIMU
MSMALSISCLLWKVHRIIHHDRSKIQSLQTIHVQTKNRFIWFCSLITKNAPKEICSSGLSRTQILASL